MMLSEMPPPIGDCAKLSYGADLNTVLFSTGPNLKLSSGWGCADKLYTGSQAMLQTQVPRFSSRQCQQ